MSIGEHLKALQEQTGMTTAQLAEKSNLPVDTINKIRSGSTRNPNADTVMRLAGALGVPADALLGGDLPETATPSDSPGTPMLTLYLAGLDRQKAAYELTIGHLVKDKHRWCFMAMALLSLFVFILIWDIAHPYMGYIRY